MILNLNVFKAVLGIFSFAMILSPFVVRSYRCCLLRYSILTGSSSITPHISFLQVKLKNFLVPVNKFGFCFLSSVVVLAPVTKTYVRY